MDGWYKKLKTSTPAKLLSKIQRSCLQWMYEKGGHTTGQEMRAHGVHYRTLESLLERGLIVQAGTGVSRYSVTEIGERYLDKLGLLKERS